MMRIARIIILVAAPLLLAALWMDKQPSYKPYQSPLLVQPVTAVPYADAEIVSPQGNLQNPVTPGRESLALGKELFDIDCAMCHGQTPVKPGAVGNKLKPPPPGLYQDRVRGLSDTAIFKAITNGFGRMPPFKDKLSPQQRWDLVNFLRTRK